MNSKHQKEKNDTEKSIYEFSLDKNKKKNDLSKEEVKKGLKLESEEKKQRKDESIKFEEEISKLRDEKLRLLAEMENLRKRVQKEKSESIKFGSANLARDVLSPKDNLTRALENIPNEKDLSEPIKNLINGLQMVQKEFIRILEKHGVKKIEALNKKFDHNLHQAMLEVESEKEEGMVVQEIQTGYTLHERLLRPAMVGVSKKLKVAKEKSTES